jgi:polysaccharide deacetylase 2 family uncharacterized protein YibQ
LLRRRAGTGRRLPWAGIILFVLGVLAGVYLVPNFPAVLRFFQRQPAPPTAALDSKERQPAKHATRPARTVIPATPAHPAPPPRPVAAGGTVRLAIVVDDLGRSLGDLETLGHLGVPLTYAVLPYESQTAAVVARLHRRGEEVLCHLPMEPQSGDNPGPGALRLGMSAAELRAATAAALDAVPGAVGVNNHMGSGLSADEPAMHALLEVLAARRLYFLDSRTSARSVGFRVAGSLGVPAAERQVFLDDDLAASAVRAQFERLLEVGRERGEAIAIGHPHPDTLSVLAEEIPRARELGYRFVPVSALLSRPAETAPAP